MKKIAAIFVFICTLALSSIPVNATSHTNPSGGYCDNTYRTWRELGLINHWSKVVYEGNNACTVTYYIIGHNKECTSCSHVFMYNYHWQCTERHSFCGQFIQHCNIPNWQEP